MNSINWVKKSIKFSTVYYFRSPSFSCRTKTVDAFLSRFLDIQCKLLDMNNTQGMKLLPTGRKSSLGTTLDKMSGNLLRMASLFVRLPRLLRAILVEIGLSKDLHDPVF